MSIENKQEKNCSTIPITYCACGKLHDNAKTHQEGQEGKMVEEKKEKIIEDFILQKNPKPFDAAECKLMDETIRGEYGDLFPFGNKPIMEVKIFVF